MKKLHFIWPSKIYKYEDKYYISRPHFYNEMSSQFNFTLYASVKEVEKIDKKKFLPLKNDVKVIDFFRELSLKNFFKNFFLYRKKLKELPKEDYYFILYPYRRLGPFLATLLRKKNLIVWVMTDPVNIYKNNPFKIWGYSLKALKKVILAPLISLIYIIVSKILFRNNLIFYTSNTTINRDNHINQHEIIACSPFNRDRSLANKELTGNVTFVGDESSQKGLHILLRTLSCNKFDFNKNLKLNIIGVEEITQNRNRKLLKEIDYKIHGKIYKRDLFYQKLSKADILVMSSFGEKQGKVQLEAMSVGVVPICSDSGGTFKTVKNYYNGLLFKEGDYKELRRKINLLYQNEELYQNLQKNGLKYIKGLSLENQVQIMSDIIKNYYNIRV